MFRLRQNRFRPKSRILPGFFDSSFCNFALCGAAFYFFAGILFLRSVSPETVYVQDAAKSLPPEIAEFAGVFCGLFPRFSLDECFCNNPRGGLAWASSAGRGRKTEILSVFQYNKTLV
jgi:hypothetical protein